MHQKQKEDFEGGCLCQAIRYRANGTPYNLTHCHCPSCRKASGAAFVSWLSFRNNDFTFTRGKPIYFASSAKVLRGFCSQCGTTLTYQLQDSGEIDVTICSLDNPESVTPEDNTWVEYKLSWIDTANDLPSYEQMRRIISQG